MAALRFLARNHDVTALYVEHGTGNSVGAADMIQEYAASLGVGFRSVAIDPIIPKGRSCEDWWREKRYEVFHECDGDVITCHHLDDCIETWVWSSMHGNPALIHERNRNVVRPFLTTPKAKFIEMARRYDIPWIEDSSNLDMRYTRNYIRHIAMPHVLRINPGIAKTIRKKIVARAENAAKLHQGMGH